MASKIQLQGVLFFLFFSTYGLFLYKQNCVLLKRWQKHDMYYNSFTDKHELYAKLRYHWAL